MFSFRRNYLKSRLQFRLPWNQDSKAAFPYLYDNYFKSHLKYKQKEINLNSGLLFLKERKIKYGSLYIFNNSEIKSLNQKRKSELQNNFKKTNCQIKIETTDIIKLKKTKLQEFENTSYLLKINEKAKEIELIKTNW